MRIPIDTVLLVIDMQKAIDDPCWGPLSHPRADDAVAALLAVWRDAGMPVIHVRHDSVEPGSPYRPGQPLHAFKPAADPRVDEPVVGKKTGSAFVGTGLEDLLTAGGHTTLVVCGVLTQNSVETTVRHAGCLGFRVFVAEDACRASALTGLDGRHFPAEAVHALSLAAMAGEYAAITTTSQAAAAATLIASRSGPWRKR
jgi:nicotinamidase-related amidase